MVHGDSVIHHIHKRKRVHQIGEKYPHPDKFKRMLDKFMYVIAIIAPLTALPQLWSIWIKKSATGVSAITWSGLILIAIAWLTYGIVHKEKQIILMYIFWIIMEVLIVVGTIIYG